MTWGRRWTLFAASLAVIAEFFFVNTGNTPWASRPT